MTEENENFYPCGSDGFGTSVNTSDTLTPALWEELERRVGNELERFRRGVLNNGTIDGMEVAQLGTPGMGVNISAGTCYINYSEYNLSSNSSLAIGAASASYNRWDIIVYNASASNVVVRAGTASSMPTYPELETDDIALALVGVPQNESQIENADITDKRLVIQQYPALHAARHADGGADLIPNSGITSAMLKTSTGSATNLTAATVAVVMNDYSFFPNIHNDTGATIANLGGRNSNAGDDTIGRFALSISADTHDVYWRYVTSSYPEHQIWMLINTSTNECEGIWESDDPPSLEDEKYLLESPIKSNRDEIESIKVYLPEKQIEKLKLKAKRNNTQLGKLLHDYIPDMKKQVPSQYNRKDLRYPLIKKK